MASQKENVSNILHILEKSIITIYFLSEMMFLHILACLNQFKKPRISAVRYRSGGAVIGLRRMLKN